MCSVNSEIFVSVLFSRNFEAAKFHENRTLTKMRNHLLMYVNHASVANF